MSPWSLGIYWDVVGQLLLENKCFPMRLCLVSLWIMWFIDVQMQSVKISHLKNYLSKLTIPECSSYSFHLVHFCRIVNKIPPLHTFSGSFTHSHTFSQSGLLSLVISCFSFLQRSFVLCRSFVVSRMLLSIRRHTMNVMLYNHNKLRASTKRLTIRMLSVPDFYHSVVMVRMYVVVLWLYSTWRTHNDMALLHSMLSSIYHIFSHTVFPHTNLSNVYYRVSEKQIEYHTTTNLQPNVNTMNFQHEWSGFGLRTVKGVSVYCTWNEFVYDTRKKIKSIFSVFDCQIATSHFYVVSVFSLSIWPLYRQGKFW